MKKRNTASKKRSEKKCTNFPDMKKQREEMGKQSFLFQEEKHLLRSENETGYI